ncbi:hypothetical protein K469DRAFT_687853 [Zopfia rhizophila CBS 207.26]|uniref:DNA/RNA-binding domain-containing protein n=1 Tax=Zopfia rhizophila CBS 207.26 TaxID=1314779 RepID=A0A6A6E6N7_9PEZI|nr:hypothetical protein K469DRAFT_687853 [Zopfia rhizophila CBS 207.26]
MDNSTEHANHPPTQGDEVTETDASSYCDASSLYCEKSFSVAILCGLPAGKKGSPTVSVATAVRSTSTLTLVAENSKGQLEYSLPSKNVPHSPLHSHGPLQFFTPRPGRPLTISSCPANPSSHDPQQQHQVDQALATPQRGPEESQPGQPAKRANTTDVRYPNLLLQPSYRAISHKQLTAEVKSIYAGLTMVEDKCIHVDRAQAAAAQDESGQPSKLGHEHWQALIALHRTLLHEHNDFFLASQHPSASPALRRLVAKYDMLARMWKHGIHSFLELLRRRLPESLEYMVTFLYLAYNMTALFYERVPAFQDTWIECLGDLARYRMAIEDEELNDRDIWAGTSRFWYSKAADRSPSVGRLYHHLAILARPNATQQLYYYCRSLTCVQQFMYARESILTLLDSFLGRMYDYKAKLNAHGSRPRQIESDDMNSIPIGALAPAQSSTSPPERTSENDIFPPQNLDFASQPTFACACRLAFTTFRLVLQRVGDENVLPHVHVMLVFLLSLTAIPYDCPSVLDNVPWEYLALFLNKLAKSEKLKSLVQNTSFPHRGQSVRPLPEDYVVQGQVWSQWYYPEGWFDASEDEEERSRELASTMKLRTERILWLEHDGRIQYNYKTHRWSAVPAPSSESSRGNARVIASMTLARLIERIKERRYG